MKLLRGVGEVEGFESGGGEVEGNGDESGMRMMVNDDGG